MAPNNNARDINKDCKSDEPEPARLVTIVCKTPEPEPASPVQMVWQRRTVNRHNGAKSRPMEDFKQGWRRRSKNG
jgi:hypothetical protein